MDETTTLTLSNDELECVRVFLSEARDLNNEPFNAVIDRVLNKIYVEVCPYV
jgi:hypothetical protein